MNLCSPQTVSHVSSNEEVDELVIERFYPNVFCSVKSKLKKEVSIISLLLKLTV